MIPFDSDEIYMKSCINQTISSQKTPLRRKPPPLFRELRFSDLRISQKSARFESSGGPDFGLFTRGNAAEGKIFKVLEP